jgi:hypothetical protein
MMTNLDARKTSLALALVPLVFVSKRGRDRHFVDLPEHYPLFVSRLSSLVSRLSSLVSRLSSLVSRLSSLVSLSTCQLIKFLSRSRPWKSISLSTSSTKPQRSLSANHFISCRSLCPVLVDDDIRANAIVTRSFAARRSALRLLDSLPEEEPFSLP